MCFFSTICTPAPIPCPASFLPYSSVVCRVGAKDGFLLTGFCLVISFSFPWWSVIAFWLFYQAACDLTWMVVSPASLSRDSVLRRFADLVIDHYLICINKARLALSYHCSKIKWDLLNANVMPKVKNIMYFKFCYCFGFLEIENCLAFYFQLLLAFLLSMTMGPQTAS